MNAIKTKITEIKVSQPAIRALQSIGIEYLEQLCDYNEDELLALHGFGKKGLEMIKLILIEHGLSLKVE